MLKRLRDILQGQRDTLQGQSIQFQSMLKRLRDKVQGQSMLGQGTFQGMLKSGMIRAVMMLCMLTGVSGGTTTT